MKASSSSNGVSKKRASSSIGGAFKSSRLSLGVDNGLDVSDVVASVGNAKVNPSKVSFQAHQVKGRYGVFTINDVDVKHIGTAERRCDGLEYFVAMVNKRTGYAEEFRPASVVQFQPKFRPAELNMDTTKAEDETKPNVDDFAARRRNLTAEFGSIKKNKFLDNSFRRQVDQNTLAAITPAVFNASVASTADAIVNVFDKLDSSAAEFNMPTSSKSLAAGDATPASDNDSFNVSLLKKAASDVLPMPNYAALKPADVYTFDQFLPKSVDDNAAGTLESEALNFFKTYSTTEELVELGVPRLLANRVQDVLKFKNPGKRACVACKAIVMAHIVKEFSSSAKAVDQSRIVLMHFPPMITSLTCSEYLMQLKSNQKVRYQVGGNRFRLWAHLLCILLLLDSSGYTLPISSLAEFNIKEVSAMRLLRGMGCDITSASPAEHSLYNTLRMARLMGAPRDKSTPRRGGRSK